MKVILEQLIEAAITQILNQNTTSHPLMKSNFFGLSFFTPEIYEAIAAAFWQSGDSFFLGWNTYCAKHSRCGLALFALKQRLKQ